MHVIAAVQVRIVGQTFPANRGTRFFNVGAHHQQQLIVDLFIERFEAISVFQRRARVVDRAWADDYQQARITAFENGAHGLAMVFDLMGKGGGQRHLLFEQVRAGQTLADRRVGGLRLGQGQSERRRLHGDYFPGRTAGSGPRGRPYRGVRQRAGLRFCVVLPPVLDRSEAASWPERDWLNRQAVKLG
ncbi:hypothetical protein D3C80_1467790 [compost metagenome]